MEDIQACRNVHKNAEKALEYAKKTARSLGHNYIGTEHILLGLLKTKGVAADILQENGVNLM